MPNNESAKKRMRQDANRRARNRWRKDRIRLQTRAFNEALAKHDVDAAEAEYRKLCGLLDQLATTSTLHRNTASRRKSRYSRKLKLAKESGTPSVA